MPEIRALTAGIPDLCPMVGRTADVVHVSNIIHYLCVQLGHYEPSEMDAAGMSRMQLGAALEQTLGARWAQTYPDEVIQVGELVVDGLHGTPDFFRWMARRVAEIKLTWMSTKWGPGSRKFWKFESQLMAYCYMLKTTLGELHVCYINGNYCFGDPGGGVVYAIYEYDFTMSELVENWRMLTTHAARVPKENWR